MTWSLFRWTWQLESPLYVGMPPSGSLNRCRLYVPARALWGAVTAEIARAKAQNRFANYKDVGSKIQGHVRFTYLFPAERSGNEWHAWLPRYVEDKGLVWQREDATHHELSDRQLRMRLLSTRPSTAIEPSSDTAAEGSLRETECMNTWWRDREGKPGGPVGLVGYVFLHADLEKGIRDRLEQLELIMVGGDTRYGLGRLRRLTKITPPGDVFGCKVDLAKKDPEVETERVLAHAELNAKAQPQLCGNLELLRGWDYGKSDHRGAEIPPWVPGSASGAAYLWRINASGHWSLSSDAT
ncbi:hypothetical protein HRbin33_00857 [bacterium HR33]|nr:hypothetical protein HRbin33_00857 [bacterium HR33]